MTDNSSMMRKQSSSIRMHVVDLKTPMLSASSLKELLHSTEGLWDQIYSDMTKEDTLWVFAQNNYSENVCWPVPMAIADFARNEADLILKNIITRHKKFSKGGDLQNAYEEILFLVKDKRSYRFNKDPIRVAHVYEGKEWGGERESGSSAYHDAEVRRYHPNGKDPGNVWLDETRDQTPDETVDETGPIPRSEALKRCIRAGSIEGETVHLWQVDDSSFEEVIQAEDREVDVRTFGVQQNA